MKTGTMPGEPHVRLGNTCPLAPPLLRFPALLRAGWSSLLGELATLANLTQAEIEQLSMLTLRDQATVLQHRLGSQALAEGGRGKDGADCGIPNPSPNTNPNPKPAAD